MKRSNLNSLRCIKHGGWDSSWYERIRYKTFTFQDLYVRQFFDSVFFLFKLPSETIKINRVGNLIFFVDFKFFF